MTLNFLKLYGLILVLLVPPALFAQAVKPKSALWYFEKGESAISAQAYLTALAHLNECLRLDPFYMEAYQSRGFVREKLGDSQGALTDYNIYLESRPDNVDALFTRGLLRYQHGQWAVAKEDFLRLLKMPPGETNTIFYQINNIKVANRVVSAQSDIRSIFFSYLGLIEIKLKKYRSAVSFFDSAARIDPKDPDHFINRGQANQMDGDTLSAINDYKKALQLNENNSIAQHNLVVLSHFNKSAQEKEKHLSETLELDHRQHNTLAERAYVRMSAGNFKGALQDYDSAIAHGGDEIDYWLNRGLVKERLKDLKGALDDLTYVVITKSDYEKGWLNRGNLLVNLNRIDEAIEDLTVAISINNEYGLAYYNRAIAYQRKNRLKEACADLGKARKLEIKVDPKLSQAICK